MRGEGPQWRPEWKEKETRKGKQKKRGGDNAPVMPHLFWDMFLLQRLVNLRIIPISRICYYAMTVMPWSGFEPGSACKRAQL